MTPEINELPPDTKWENGKLEQQPREMPDAKPKKPFAVSVVHGMTGVEVWNGRVRADDLREAEEIAVAKAALETKGDPALLEARRVHELCPLCGQIKPGGAEF